LETEQRSWYTKIIQIETQFEISDYFLLEDVFGENMIEG